MLKKTTIAFFVTLGTACTTVAPASDERSETTSNLASNETAPAATAPPIARGCPLPVGAKQHDLDPADSPEVPFVWGDGPRVLVQFANAGASDRYVTLLKQAATTWSRSACIQALVVAACDPGVNCVILVEEETAGDGETDGEFTGDEPDGAKQRTSGKITLFRDLMDKTSDNGALATITHEMGHAFGLVHRLSKTDLMNAETDDNTNPIPDAIDFLNLRVIYGRR